MKKSLLITSLFFAACSSPKTPATDDFSSLANVDTKSDAFSKHMKIVGSLDYGTTSDDVAYSNPPKYRAFKFGGQKGDTVDIWVRSADGDAVAWLLDNSFKTIAHNDDADDTTTDSHLTATLPGNSNPAIITYYIVFREYSLQDATFQVQLDGKGADFFACNVDSDCVAVPRAGCCNNGYKEAVNKSEVAAYDAANACANPHPICPLYVINDTRVAECNFQSHECEMIDPAAIHCGGFINPSHQCPAGFTCQLGHIPDAGGTCVPKTCVQNVFCVQYSHWDSTACACVANPSCGGIAARPCTNPALPNCIDDPRDSCDPAHGGADCPGVCVP
jgi:hypothetical protein